jgi:conjugal transfer pilus assembly protein TraK
MRRLTLSCLSAALAVVFSPVAAFAQDNPFVSAAQAPGIPNIPAPPVPPAKQNQPVNQPVSTSPVQQTQPANFALPVPPPPTRADPNRAAGIVFNHLKQPTKGKASAVPPAPAHPATSNIEQAAPGQTLTAPPLPNMPPVPAMPQHAKQDSIGGPSFFGGIVQQIDPVRLAEQTSPVDTLKFMAEVGKTYRLKVSSVAPNLIMSPFEHPKLIMTSANAVHFVAHGSSLVVTVAPGEPIGAYITGENNNDPLIALVFIPKNLPPQNYELQVDGFAAKAKTTANAQGNEAASSADGDATTAQGSSMQYTQRVVHLIEQTMSGVIPEGFGSVSRRHWPLGRNQGGLMVLPVEVLSSGEEIIEVLRVTNTTDKPVSLEENDFYRRGVNGVAISAHAPLLPGASVQVGILRQASRPDALDTLMSVSHP